MRVPGRHLSVTSCKDLFHQYGSIREFSILAVILSRARRRVRVVQLGVAVEILHRICSERLVMISIVCRLANVSHLVNKIESVEATVALRFDLLMAGQTDQRDDERDDEGDDDL